MLAFLFSLLAATVSASTGTPHIPLFENWQIIHGGYIDLEGFKIADQDIYVNPDQPADVGRIIKFKNGVLLKEWSQIVGGKVEYWTAIVIGGDILIMKRRHLAVKTVRLLDGDNPVWAAAVLVKKDPETKVDSCFDELLKCYNDRATGICQRPSFDSGQCAFGMLILNFPPPADASE